MVDIVPRDQRGEVDETTRIKRRRKRQKIGGEQPFAGFAQRNAGDDQRQPRRHQAHPDEGGDAPVGQRIDVDIEIEPKDRRDHQRDVLGYPEVDEAPDQRIGRGGAARLQRRQHEAGGDQRRDDQRIGAAMGVGGVGHAIGQRHPAPEVGGVEHGLHGKHQVEDDERAQDRGLAEQRVLEALRRAVCRRTRGCPASKSES